MNESASTLQAEEKQALLAAIIASSEDAIISKTLDGIITSWNPAAEKMFGYTEVEAVNQHISLIIPKERLSEETYIISQVSANKRIDHFETVRIGKGGREIPLSLSVSPILDEKGRVIGASKIARDISELLAAQADRERLYHEVSALNDKKDEFIGLASHELKTPLTSIIGYLQILDHTIKDEKAKPFLKKTLLQVKKLNSLVSDLLDVSKIEAGKLQFANERFDIRAVIDDAIELIAHANEKFKIKLDTDITELFINADPHRIEQVILNLLSNAIRYSPGGKKVEVYLRCEENELKIGVRDFGVGIPADKLEDVFSRFYRVDNSNPHISGLGIGLYLSQEIVARHHGHIWAESEFGKGSTFWFTLPR